ncbi:hypothetical protein HYPSUDRAFT_38207 [Hypholoma sublateritium FD-334 SS-4]|uniref:DUF6534 domain-containing protein n=1 Tax=Hypholoma sublateritium (strain FD-334 SS-4) TaxID=945553 RepID=A0A0D2PZV0_HYPSF|nr:hypothetical protein HYPSUDRAFT_38207 [Hypholoma sublateritium FD-334 SS-4]
MTSPASPLGEGLPADLDTTLAAAFFGFSAGAILFGIGIRQAYEYYTTTNKDSLGKKLIIGIACVLDTLHLAFSMNLVYNLVINMLGYTEAGMRLVWSLKALGSTQVVLIILVQGFYLSQIWRVSARANLLLEKWFSIAIQTFVVFIGVFALAVGVIFLTRLQTIDVVHSFDLGFEYIVYLGFGATAIIDCSIAGAMCLLLHKSSSGTIKVQGVLETLIQYFIGSGLLTSFASILCIILYVAQPNTLLYLGMELSVPRLYANSLLAIANGRQGLLNRLDESIDLHLPSGVFFVEPDRVSLVGAHLKDTYSPEREPKYPEHMVTDPFASPTSTRQRYIGIPLSDPFSPGSETKYSPTDSEGSKSLSRASSRSHTV